MTTCGEGIDKRIAATRMLPELQAVLAAISTPGVLIIRAKLQFTQLGTDAEKAVRFVRGAAPGFTPEDIKEGDMQRGATEIAAMLRYREKVLLNTPHLASSFGYVRRGTIFGVLDDKSFVIAS